MRKSGGFSRFAGEARLAFCGVAPRGLGAARLSVNGSMGFVKALLRYCETHQSTLTEGFLREDLRWGLHGND